MKEQENNVQFFEGTEDELISNTEFLNRQLSYLATVRTYLEQQLELCNLELSRISDELKNS